MRSDLRYATFLIYGSGSVRIFFIPPIAALAILMLLANCYGASSSRSLSRHVQPIRESYLLLFASFFCGCEWYEVYDFLEFALHLDNNEFLSVALNNVLEHELAWHRHVSQPFVPVTDSEEIETIENLFVSGPFAGAAPHLMSVIDHLGRQQALEC